MKVLLRKSYEVYDFVENWPSCFTCALVAIPKSHYLSLEALMNKKSECHISNAGKQRSDLPEKPYETEIHSLDFSNGTIVDLKINLIIIMIDETG